MSRGFAPTHRFYSPWHVALRLLKGNSLVRALFNLALRRHEIGGEVLDIGSKSAAASYYEFICTSPRTRVTFTDLQPQPGVLELDVEAPFDLPSESFDVVLAFHLFEHVFHFDRAPGEVFRILRDGGRVFVSMPFLHEYHPDPEDYVRLTDSGLRRLWESEGFRCIHMEVIGEGLLTAAITKFTTEVMPRTVRPLIAALAYLIATGFDRVASLRPAIGGRTLPMRFAQEYFAVFEKGRS